MALPLTLKHISRQKNNYGSSNISPSFKNTPNLQNPKTLARSHQNQVIKQP
jgi:hypothetical protein